MYGTIHKVHILKGRGKGSRKTFTPVIFMTSFYCFKVYKRGGDVLKSPNVSVHTWWMAPIICMLNKTSFVEHMLQCWLHMIINIFLTLTLLIMHFMIFQLYHIDVVNMDMYKYALFSLTQCQLTSRYISSMCVATSCQLFSPFTMILTSFS